MPFQQWPYTDFQNLNLDWILKMIKKMGAEFAPKILESVNEWLNAHPEATTTVQDGSITPAKLQPSFLDDLSRKINKEYTPAVTEIGTIPHNSEQIQGMTTDGIKLFVCGDNGEEPITIYEVNPNTLATTPHTISGVYGHANSACYCDGYIYLTGCNTTGGATIYTKIAKINTRTWVGEFININQGGGWQTEWWSVEIATAYNGKHLILGHRADTALIDVFSSVYAGVPSQLGLNKWLPWQTIDIGPFACDPAGMAQYGKYILIGDAHLGNQFAKNTIRVFTTDGGFKCNIYLPAMGNHELEDICVIGNTAYVNEIGGRIYSFPLNQILGINYDMVAFSPTGGFGIKYAYIADNGSETYTDLGDNNSFCTSFRTNPFYFPSSGRIIDTALVLPYGVIKGVLAESQGTIRYNGTIAFGNNAIVAYDFVYTPTSPTDNDEYLFVLTSAKAVAYYDGEINHYNTLQDIANAGYIGGQAFVRSIVYDSAPKYTYYPINI